jgi:LmbE family N-acetylglucosaminyl deacetylase
MPPETLANLRQKEAIAAARYIGLAPNDVLFLGLKDGKLSHQENQAIAIERVTAILHQHQPEEIYVPYYLEPHPDHVATHTAVMGALQHYGRSVMVYEYPVWFWNCWPWVRFASRDWRDGVNQLKWVMKSNLRLVQDFHHVVYVADVLENKRTALAQHQSQVQRLLPQPEWVVLEDMAEGAFLRCLFQDHEIFYGHRFPQNHSYP